MERRIASAWKIAACSLAVLCLAGCNLTLGPKVETRYVIVRPGLPVTILENRSVRARVLNNADGGEIRQDVGGWVAMPPEHWAAVKREIERLRE